MWIYILIILIFVTRGVIKSAERQRKTGTGHSRQDTVGGPQADTEYIFPYNIPEENKAERETVVFQAEPNAKGSKAGTSPAERKRRLVSRMADTAPEQAGDAGAGYFADAEEVRKGIIAAEILDRKY